MANLMVKADGEWGNHTQTYTGTGRIRYTFDGRDNAIEPSQTAARPRSRRVPVAACAP